MPSKQGLNDTLRTVSSQWTPHMLDHYLMSIKLSSMTVHRPAAALSSKPYALVVAAPQLPADPNSQALAFVDGGVVPASISALQLLQSCSPAIRSQPPSTGVPAGVLMVSL